MSEPANTGAGRKRPNRIINVDEWIEIVSQMHRMIKRDLDAMEHRQVTGERHKPELDEKDTRRLQTIVRTIERAQIINEKVEIKQNLTEGQRLALKEIDDSRKLLQHRVAKVLGEGEA
jgi:hypothetical protein